MRYAAVFAAVAMLALFRSATVDARPAADSNWPFPYIFADFTNDTGLPAEGIVVDVYPAANLQPLRNIPEGCDVDPTLTFDPDPIPYGELTVRWPTACVAPGVTLHFLFGVDCDCSTPSVSSHTWLTVEVTPSPRPTPPIGDPTPLPSRSPSPSPSPTPSPTPSASPTASPTAVVTPAALPKTGGAPSSGVPSAGWLLAGVVAMAVGFGLARRGVRR